MADTAKVNGADIDKALETLQLQKSVDNKVVLEKGMTVDKRAMGGATKTEDDESSTGVGRKQKDVKNPELGLHPAQKRSGNFATKFKEGHGLADSNKEMKTPSTPNRGLSKAVEEKSSKSSKSSASSASSKSSKSSMKKALPPNFVKKDDAKSSKSSASSSSSASSVKKGVDGSCSSASSMKKGVAPSEKSSASSGSESGAPKLGKVVNKGMSKAIDLLASAQKHLTKAFEDGSDTDLDKTGARLIEAKDALVKAVEAGEKISPDVLARVNKAGSYFEKALETYEKEDAEGHVAAVGKTQKHLSKAIESYKDFEKSLEAAPVKTDTDLRIARRGDKFVMEMTEDQAKKVQKSLEKDNLYKSVDADLPEDVKKAMDATPLLKGLFTSLIQSNNSLRDTLADKSESDRDFRKSVMDAIAVVGQAAKQAVEDVEKMKGTPNLRKSVVIPTDSPKGAEAAGAAPGAAVDVTKIEAVLEKGIEAKLVGLDTFLAFDVDRHNPELIGKYAEIAKSIEARLK
ncbi:Uncharacterised protein [uncultured archaeon]|nr:Uncharacterised protein [uncultured archaeon]